MHPKLKILEEKAKAATQGPWFPNSSPHYRGPISEVEMFYTTDDDGIHFPEKDAKFMAAANPETVQKLVRVIEVLFDFSNPDSPKTRKVVQAQEIMDLIDSLPV